MKKIVWFFIFSVVVVGGSWLFLDQRVRSFCNQLFSIKIINVEGNKTVKTARIIKDSGLKYNENMFKFDPKEVKFNIEKIGEIENVIISRRIPCMFNIIVEERKPIAYWKNEDNIYYIDMKGKEFPINSGKISEKLPLILGKNAPQEVCNLIRQLDKYPHIKEHVVFCNFVGNRRWNIQMNDGILIKLPEENIRSAIAYLSKICNSVGQLDKNLSVIDLRIGNRVIFREKVPNKSTTKRKNNEI